MSLGMVHLGGYVDLVMGQAPPGETCNKEGEGTVFVKAGEFQERSPAIKEWTTKPLKFAKTNDTLVCVVGATAGKVNLAAFDCAIGRSVSAVRPIPDKIDPLFLFHFLQTTVGLLRDRAQGAAQGVITREMLQSLSLVLPPLPEQRRIAAILDQADALRAKRREALAELDQLTQSIFIEMFGDPVTNPMGWPVGRLDRVSEVGSSKRVFVEELVPSGIPFFRGTEVGQLGEGQSVEPSLFISKEHYERLKAEAGVPTKGDLLLPSICPDGRIYMVQDHKPFYFKDGRVLWINVKQGAINSVFLRQQLKQLFISNYSKIASGTTFAELKIFALKNLGIYLPPLDIQEQFSAIAGGVTNQTDIYKTQQTELEGFFSSLQHRAFRGEL